MACLCPVSTCPSPIIPVSREISMTMLWGGRFAQKLDAAAWDLNSSLPVDKRMAIQDVDGSLAWVDGLRKAKILSDEEHAQIALGLATVKEEFSSGKFIF